METTTKPTGIYAALASAQMAMGPALKDSTNPAFKSKYADLASVMAACMPALNANGIAVIQPTIDDENGARFVKTILAHISGETLECRVPLIVSKNDMQGYGSAVTYARRYGLMGMAGIAPEDDDGNAASGPRQEYRRDDPPPRQAPQQPKPPTLADRANAFEGKMRAQETVDGIERAWKLGSGLCAELDTADPERLAELTMIREQLLDQITEAADPFAEPAMEAA